ncbi:MAG: NAD(P)-binding domain-containing protein [Deltaproteobacteria bacterium]|nr:NAD(P)-binding domain-containing protein [Deltaproteobacteria bacterium]
MEKVGMIGVGAMGSVLLERLKLAGGRATVFDLLTAPLEAARSMGADVASSSAAVAQASTIIDVVVRTDQEILDSVLGKDGVLEGARADTLVLLHSTILPETTRKVADAASKRGVFVIDACMTSVPRVVREGKLSFLVGGPTELVDRARPHLLQMGKRVFHMGPLGAGNVAKLIKNLVTGAETLLIHEAIQIGEAGGIPYREVLEMMRQVYSGTILNRWQERFDPSGASSTPKAGLNVFEKDIPLAAELGKKFGLDIPITEQLAAAGQRLVRAKAS